jgi:hypothetical protein
VSFKLLRAATSLNSIQIDGGTFVFNLPSSSDIYGSAYVVCHKHPDKITPVNFGFTMSEYSVFDAQKAATEALRNCPSCLETEAAKNTRFPEGAEL